MRHPSGDRLRVASVVDEFTAIGLAPDCDLHELTPDRWQAQIEAARPHLLFVESAWRGSGGAWHNTVHELPQELRDVLDWCRDRGVPTVFWNKEDPVHRSRFLATAARFDHVFTTDLESIPHYRAALGHDRIHLLLFACQPRVHHPIHDGVRRDAVCFAGAYYGRYPERARDLEDLVTHLGLSRPVEIYDRNLGGTDPYYMFPEAYRSLVVGTLAPREVPRAFRAYRYGLNLNSVTTSSTMLARRVLELMACGTITVSNRSPALSTLVGELAVTGDSGAEVAARVAELAADPDRLDRLRVAALRTVMTQHTVGARLAQVLSVATGQDVQDDLPGVAVLARAGDRDEMARLLAAVGRQRGVRPGAVVVVPDGLDAHEPAQRGVVVHRESEVADRRIGDVVGGAGAVAVFHPDDHYGEHHVLDLLLGTRYGAVDAVGRVTRHRWGRDGLTVVDRGAEYRSTDVLPVRSSLVRTDVVARKGLLDLLGDTEHGAYQGVLGIALDRFGYCENGAGAPRRVARAVGDLELDTGTPVDELLRRARALATAPEVPAGAAEVVALPNQAVVVPHGRLAQWFAASTRRGWEQHAAPRGWEVIADLADGTHDYFYADELVPVAELWPDGPAPVRVDAVGDLSFQMVLLLLDGDGERVGTVWARPGRSAEAEVDARTASVKVGLRASGPGRAVIRALLVGPAGQDGG